MDEVYDERGDDKFGVYSILSKSVRTLESRWDEESARQIRQL